MYLLSDFVEQNQNQFTNQVHIREAQGVQRNRVVMFGLE